MYIEFLDDIEIPLEWRSKFSALRNHRYRIKNCIDCLVKIEKVNTIPENEANNDVNRHKICFHCSNKFLDLSITNGRFFCYRCAAFYSPEFLTKSRKESGKLRLDFWNK